MAKPTLAKPISICVCVCVCVFVCVFVCVHVCVLVSRVMFGAPGTALPGTALPGTALHPKFRSGGPTRPGRRGFTRQPESLNVHI